MASKTLKVVGQQTMHCGGCEHTVKFTLTQLPGVRQVEANHKTQLIQLSYDPETLDLAQVQQELDWIGYQVADVEEP